MKSFLKSDDFDKFNALHKNLLRKKVTEA